MIRKGTWIVLGVFVILIAAVLILQRTRGNVQLITQDITPSATTAPLLLTGWQAQDITYLEWRGEGQTLTLTRNEDGSWVLGPDNNAPVDTTKVNSLTSSLVALRPLSSLGAGNPIDALGLSTPANIIILRTASGSQAQLNLGNTTPTDSGYYAQVDNREPVVVDKYLIEAILDKFMPVYWNTPTPLPATPTASSTVVP